MRSEKCGLLTHLSLAGLRYIHYPKPHSHQDHSTPPVMLNPLWAGSEPDRHNNKDTKDQILRSGEWGLFVQLLLAGLFYADYPIRISTNAIPPVVLKVYLDILRKWLYLSLEIGLGLALKYLFSYQNDCILGYFCLLFGTYFLSVGKVKGSKNINHLLIKKVRLYRYCTHMRKKSHKQLAF